MYLTFSSFRFAPVVSQMFTCSLRSLCGEIFVVSRPRVSSSFPRSFEIFRVHSSQHAIICLSFVWSPHCISRHNWEALRRIAPDIGGTSFQCWRSSIFLAKMRLMVQRSRWNVFQRGLAYTVVSCSDVRTRLSRLWCWHGHFLRSGEQRLGHGSFSGGRRRSEPSRRISADRGIHTHGIPDRSPSTERQVRRMLLWRLAGVRHLSYCRREGRPLIPFPVGLPTAGGEIRCAPQPARLPQCVLDGL